MPSARNRSGSSTRKAKSPRARKPSAAKPVPPEAEPPAVPDVVVEPGSEGGVATKAVEAANAQDAAAAAESNGVAEVPEGMAQARVALGSHLYWYVNENGKRRQGTAHRGEVLTLDAAEIERGLAIEALVPLDDPLTDPTFDPLDLEDAALAKWVSTHTVDEVVSHASSVERANRLLMAERDATDGDARVGVLRGIEAILSSGRV